MTPPFVSFCAVLESLEGPKASTVDRRKALATRNAMSLFEASNEVDQSMVHNLCEEAHLTEADWLDLIERFAASPPDVNFLRDSVLAFCRSARPEQVRPLGPPATPGNTNLGRVLTLKAFAHILVVAELFNWEDEAIEAIQAAIGAPPAALRSRAETWPLGSFAMWSTFCPDSDTEPFSTTLATTTDLCHVLGLPGVTTEEHLIVLRYSLPRDVVPKVPTFFDGYAGQSWIPWFRVPPAGGRYGMTRPWGLFEERGRPEVVHAVINVSYLSASMELARSEGVSVHAAG